jgi:phage-related protein
MITVICEKIGGFLGEPGSSAMAAAAGSVDIWATAKLPRNARATERSRKRYATAYRRIPRLRRKDTLVYRMWYNGLWQIYASSTKAKKDLRPTCKVSVRAVFYRTEARGESVGEWLKSLPSREDRKRIGEDIKTVEFGWPVGMPVCRSVGGGIYEVRSDLAQNRIARVLFYFDKSSRMVLLHALIKKTRKTPDEDLDLAQRNKKKHERSQ